LCKCSFPSTSFIYYFHLFSTEPFSSSQLSSALSSHTHKTHTLMTINYTSSAHLPFSHPLVEPSGRNLWPTLDRHLFICWLFQTSITTNTLKVHNLTQIINSQQTPLSHIHIPATHNLITLWHTSHTQFNNNPSSIMLSSIIISPSSSYPVPSVQSIPEFDLSLPSSSPGFNCNYLSV
jgi:hypothetical protein